MEPVILDMLAEERKLFIATRGARYRDSEHDWMAAEIDAETPDDDGIVNIEAKSVHPFAADQFGEEGTDEIPIYYAAQAMYGMMVTGRQRCIFAVLVGADNLSVYELMRDDETIAGIRDKAVTFWRDHVLAKIPPEPIVLEDVMRLMRRDADITATASAEIAGYIAEMNALRQRARAATERVDELKFQVGKWLLGAQAIETPTRKPKHIIVSEYGTTLMTISYQEQSRIDSNTLRKKYPAIAAECSKTTSLFKFDTPKGKR
jgi:predicted phage-related endonuclease